MITNMNTVLAKVAEIEDRLRKVGLSDYDSKKYKKLSDLRHHFIWKINFPYNSEFKHLSIDEFDIDGLPF